MKYGLKKQNKKIMQQYVINFNHVLDSLVQLITIKCKNMQFSYCVYENLEQSNNHFFKQNKKNEVNFC